MRDSKMQRCIEECTECQEVCLGTIIHCLRLGGKHADAKHIRTMIDCAEICQTSANFMLRGSELHIYSCGACAEICDACAKSCEQIGGDDREIKRCAETCRRCAESCREMAGAAHKAA